MYGDSSTPPMLCAECRAQLATGARFCAHCGAHVYGPSAGAAGMGGANQQHLRQAGQSLSAAAAPFLNGLASRVQNYAAGGAESPAAEADGQSSATTQPAYAVPPPRSTTIPEKIGRGMGNTVGYGIRGVAGTTVEPAREAWVQREALPMWQNIVGAIGLAVNFASIVGIFLIGLVYLALVISGGHGPGQAFRRLLQICAWLFLVEFAAVVLFVLVALGSQ
jgi:hypothetical protein